MGGTPMGRGRRSIIRGTLGVHNCPRRSRWLFARPRPRASTRAGAHGQVCLYPVVTIGLEPDGLGEF
jgi:hypothetical protein